MESLLAGYVRRKICIYLLRRYSIYSVQIISLLDNLGKFQQMFTQFSDHHIGAPRGTDMGALYSFTRNISTNISTLEQRTLR